MGLGLRRFGPFRAEQGFARLRVQVDASLHSQTLRVMHTLLGSQGRMIQKRQVVEV